MDKRPRLRIQPTLSPISSTSSGSCKPVYSKSSPARLDGGKEDAHPQTTIDDDTLSREPSVRLVKRDSQANSLSTLSKYSPMDPESAGYMTALSRNSSVQIKELPSLPSESPLTMIPLSPYHTTANNLLSHPTLADVSSCIPLPPSPKSQKKFRISLPKLPKIQTSGYLISIPAALGFGSFTKSTSARSVQSQETQRDVPTVMITKAPSVSESLGEFVNGLPPSPVSTLVSPTATGYLFPRREDYSFDPTSSSRPPLNHGSTPNRLTSAREIRYRKNLGSPLSRTSTASLDNSPDRHTRRYPNSSPRLPLLLRHSTTPNLTSKFPIPRALSVAARSQAERSQADVEAGNTFLMNLGIESFGRWTGFKWVLLVSVITVSTCVVMDLKMNER